MMSMTTTSPVETKRSVAVLPLDADETVTAGAGTVAHPDYIFLFSKNHKCFPVSVKDIAKWVPNGALGDYVPGRQRFAQDDTINTLWSEHVLRQFTKWLETGKIINPYHGTTGRFHYNDQPVKWTEFFSEWLGLTDEEIDELVEFEDVDDRSDEQIKQDEEIDQIKHKIEEDESRRQEEEELQREQREEEEMNRYFESLSEDLGL